jgi:cellulose synthase/poly-beta-1,6-N-acetylglucosamine synthase-like glycosyltransferase
MYALAIVYAVSFFIVLYTYVGYGVIVGVLAALKRIAKVGIHQVNEGFEPHVALVVPCYNEADILPQKVADCMALHYPKSKLDVIFITDGSTDGSEDVLKKYPQVIVLHQPERNGKAAAENRAIAHVKADFVVFCDANTKLCPDAIKQLIKHFADEKVGAVSGEKRVASETNNASSSGEGLYWKYESWLKKQDSDLHTTAGAAGELIAFRKACFTTLENDTILDDFVASMRIAINGFKVVYEPNAYAQETASASVSEETKRKIRIAAGAWQALFRLPKALNPFHDALLAFIYFSHKVMRWSLAPLALIALIPTGLILHLNVGGWFSLLWIFQLAFYFLASLGKVLEHKHVRIKLFFIPYYFVVTNYCMIAGFVRFVRGNQSVKWEKASRA